MESKMMRTDEEPSMSTSSRRLQMRAPSSLEINTKVSPASVWENAPIPLLTPLASCPTPPLPLAGNPKPLADAETEEARREEGKTVALHCGGWQHPAMSMEATRSAAMFPFIQQRYRMVQKDASLFYDLL